MKRLNCLQVFSAFALLAARLTAGEIWITNGTAYSTSGGSAADPVVLDTPAHFDSYMSGIPANSHIHLMAGTFQTAAGINVKSGWTIQGDGMDRTFIQASNLVTAGYHGVVFGNGASIVTNVYVSDLTVDCNFQNQPSNGNLAMSAGLIVGTDLHLTRLKAINFGCTITSGMGGPEDFVLGLQLSDTPYTFAATNLTIDGCVLTQPSTFNNAGYVNGLFIFGGCNLSSETDPTPVTAVGPGWVIGAEIKNCKIYGINAPGHAISWAGVADAKIHDNMVFDCPNLGATYMEDSVYSDLEIANNFFDDVSLGIDLFDADALVRLRNNLSIHDNNIKTVGGFAIRISANNTTSFHNGVSIQNNEVTTPVGSDPSTYDIELTGATNAVVTGNTVSSSSAYAPLIYMQTVTNVTVRNNSTIDGDTLPIWDNTGLKQGEEESTITYSFIPSSVGWYRLATTGNALTGKAVIAYQASGDYSDVEADFTGNGFLGGNIGTITCTRDLNYGLAISGLRLGTDGWTGSSAPVYFDIYVSTVDGSPVYVKLIMDADTAVYSLAPFLGGCAAPTGVAPTPTYASVLDLAYEGGVQMIGSLIVSNSVIVTPNGQIKSSQLDSAGLTGIATLSPSSGGLMLGNGSAWTATSMSGDATLSSAGHLTVTNIASTAGPLGGYQYITSSTALTGSSARVIQASNVVTITLPASATIGKEFLIQNLNSSGTVTMSGTIVGSTTVSAGNAAIAVVRPDGKWQVHSF